MFRSEFVSLIGSADFYVADVVSLNPESETALRVFLEASERRGIEQHKHFPSKYSLRINLAIYEGVAISACSRSKSEPMRQ